MKKYRFYGGLFIPLLLITTSYNYLTNNVKNTNNYSPPLAQAQPLAIHTTPYKRSSLLLHSGLLGQTLFSRNKAPDPRMAPGGSRPSKNYQNQRPPALE